MTEDPLISMLRDVARHDRDAFRGVYRHSASKLAGVLTRILGDRADVEDALQEVYIRVWQRAGQYDAARGAPMGWLIAIARNVALDRLRARPQARGVSFAVVHGEAPGPEPLDQLPATGPGPEAAVMAGSDARRIMDCFDELEADRAAAVRGAYLQGLSYQQLAERHAVPLNTIRTWLRRGLMRLKECLDR